MTKARTESFAHAISALLSRQEEMMEETAQIRADVLREIGGWDPYNVTEDADLGYRLACEGYRADVIAPPTYKEAPITFPSWLNQRTRWIKGHLQTCPVLARDPLKLFHRLGFKGVFAMHMTIGAGVASAFLHGPLLLLVLASTIPPLGPLSTPDVILILFGYCVAAFSALSASALSGELSHTRGLFHAVLLAFIDDRRGSGLLRLVV